MGGGGEGLGAPPESPERGATRGLGLQETTVHCEVRYDSLCELIT